MPGDSDKSLDILGLKPIGNSFENLASGVVAGASAFLSRVCLPAAEEFGGLLQDNVKAWRAANAARIAQRAEEKLREQGRDSESVRGNARIICAALEQGSWNEDSVVQDFWAGLLASACDESSTDDSNNVFVSLLSQLSAGQVRFLRFQVESCPKFVSRAGWPYAKSINICNPQLKEIFNTSDINRIDIALDHLRNLGLLDAEGGEVGGFSIESSEAATVAPTSLALHMYLAGEGVRRSPNDYWQLQQGSEY